MASAPELAAEAPIRRPALVHVCFAAAEKMEGATAQYLRALWSAYDAIQMTAPVPSVAESTSFPSDSISGGTGTSAVVLAAKQRHAPGAAYQAFLIAYHDTIALIASLAPNREGDTLSAWRELARERAAVAANGPSPDGILGEALIFIALSPRSVSWSPQGIGDAVVAELASASGARPTGQLVFESPESLALWELGAGPTRVFGLVAPEERESELDGWVWWQSGGLIEQLPPLVRTLLHAAKLRYEVGVLERESPKVRASEDEIDRAIAAQRPLHRRIDDELPVPSEVLAQAQRHVTKTRVRTSELLRLTTRLVELRQSIVIAQRNLERLAPERGAARSRELFDVDIRRAERAVEQIGHELAYSEAVLRRAAEMHALSDLLLRREEERHAKVRNDLALIQTSLLAALLAGLGAIQTFGGQADVSPVLRAPLVALILALVFALPLLFVRWYERLRMIDHFAAAMLGGSAAWVALTGLWLLISGENVHYGLQVAAIVAGAALALAFTRRIGKRRTASRVLSDPQEVHER
ncbi:MAG: CATRA conflict system CASPASE/TPR repeat-associated protein [Gaiellales bacterium]